MMWQHMAGLLGRMSHTLQWADSPPQLNAQILPIAELYTCRDPRSHRMDNARGLTYDRRHGSYPHWRRCDLDGADTTAKPSVETVAVHSLCGVCLCGGTLCAYTCVTDHSINVVRRA